MVKLDKYIEGEVLNGDIIAMLPEDKRKSVVLPFGHGWITMHDRSTNMAIQKPVFYVELNAEKFEVRLTVRLARLLVHYFGNEKETEKWAGKTIDWDVTKKKMFGEEKYLLSVKARNL